MKKTKALFIVLGIYILADLFLAASVMIFKDIIDSAILVMFIADVIATVVVYIFGMVLKNASVYDPYWSVMPVFMILAWYIFYNVAFSPLHLIVLIPFLIWAVRLTLNWVMGFTDLKWQDWRYTKFKNDFPKFYPVICFVGIMFMPTVFVFMGLIPMWFFINSTAFSVFSVVSSIVILFAVTYQTLADKQMKNFRLKNSGAGTCIDEGLWKYSRHPNYLGEILIWLGVAVSALSLINDISILNISAPLFYVLTFLGFIFMVLLFTFISIPLMERHLIKTKQSYLEYKKVVRSPLIPFSRNKDS